MTAIQHAVAHRVTRFIDLHGLDFVSKGSSFLLISYWRKWNSVFRVSLRSHLIYELHDSPCPWSENATLW